MEKHGYSICDNCSTHECEYVELMKFVIEYNEATGKNFEWNDCPDKSGLDYTCDLVFIDTNTKEKLYIETKEIQFGVGKGREANILLGQNNGQMDCVDLISSAICYLCNEDIQDELSEFAISIPRVKIYESEKGTFCTKLAESLMNLDLSVDSFTFCFDGRDGKTEIVFHRKDEKLEELSDQTLVELNCEKDNTIEKILNKVRDTNLLLDLINKNIAATSQKKFPDDVGKKILINILKLPVGYDIFFNRNIEYIFGKIVSAKLQDNPVISESYLLYYCEDYTTYDNNTIKSYGNSLFVLPIIKGVFDEPTVFVDKGEGD